MTRVIKETVFPDCPIRNVLARICDKWSLLIIYTLNAHGGEPVRFNALRKQIPDISQKMLTSTLKTLEADGYSIVRSMRRCRREWSIHLRRVRIR